MSFQLQTLGLVEKSSKNDETHSGEYENGCQQNLSYFSSPTWSSTPLQHKNSEKICESLNSNLDKEQFTTKNRILSQLLAEEFTLEDVREMQKIIKDLHSENIKKTISCNKLEQNCHSLKEEVAYLKNQDFKEKENSKSCHMETYKSPVDVLREEKLVKELNECKHRCDTIQREEFRLRELVAVYEERFQYFLKIVSNASSVFAENKNILDATKIKIQILESEIATWKERENKENEKKKMLHSLVEEIFSA